MRVSRLWQRPFELDHLNEVWLSEVFVVYDGMGFNSCIGHREHSLAFLVHVSLGLACGCKRWFLLYPVYLDIRLHFVCFVA